LAVLGALSKWLATCLCLVWLVPGPAGCQVFFHVF
jgi:hypothetical protein